MPHNHYISLCSVAAIVFSMSLVSYGLLPDQQDNALPAAAQNQPVIRLEPTAVQKAAASQIPQAEIYWDKTTGVPISLHAPDLGRIKLGGRGLTVSADKDFAANSVAVLDRLSALYGFTDAQNEFDAIRVKKDELNYHHVYLRQLYQDLRVIGGELLVHFNQANTACHVNGRYVPSINIDITPTLSDEEALAKARADLQRRGLTVQSVAAEPELVVYARNTIEGKLAYELTLACGIGQEWCYWIDANSGSIINCFNNVRKEKPTTSKGYSDQVPTELTGNLLPGEGGYNMSLTGISILFHNPDGPDYTYYYLYNPINHWIINNAAYYGYEDTNAVASRSTAQWGTSDPAEFSAAYNFDKVQTYFINTFQRDSYDRYGHDANVYVHYTWAGFDNAFYSTLYDAFYFLWTWHYADLTTLDGCAHEFTHAINYKEINFTYQGEQGALDEALADIFGTAVEFAVQPDGTDAYPGCLPGHADWLIGEDYIYPVATAWRDLRNPQRFEQPSLYQGTCWIDPTSSYDYGGVHINCGVIAFAFYLLAHGDTGLNDNTYPYTVTGIGLTNAVNLIYRYQNYYATSGDTFQYGLRYGWISAAYDLNSNWVCSVNSALNAVGLWAWDAIPPNPSAIYLAAAGDCDGDHKADIIGYRNNIWHIWLSASGYARADISTFTDAVGTPFAADFDGDGLADPGVYDTSGNWHLWLSSASYSRLDLSTFTGASGMPVPADFDGDGKADPAVWDFDGNWHIWFSSAGYSRIDITTLKGISGGVPVAADFDGDGKADPAIYNYNSTWYIWLSSIGYTRGSMYTLTGTSSMPVPADFDGDGKADPAFYDCNGNWHMWLSGSGYAWVDLTTFKL